jgi:hypothetical protein
VSSENTTKADLIQNFSNEFEMSCKKRMREGAVEYGETAFLEANVIEMAKEEVLDLANYAKMLFIKIRLLEHELVTEAGKI